MDNSRIDHLASQVIAGQADINQLLKVITPYLTRFIQTKANPDNTQDILQETLISLSQSLPLWSQQKPFLSFAYGIARHEIADFYLKQKGKHIILRLTSFVIASTVNFLDKIEARDTLRFLFAKLPLHYKLILILKYHHGLSIKQIANRLHTTPKAAESLLFRARAKSRQILLKPK